MNEDRVFLGLDIGTTKIAAVIARLDEYNMLNIAGVGTAPSYGLRRGVVINIEKTVDSIVKAIDQAQLMAGTQVSEVYAGIAGDHIRSINSKGVIAVSGKDKIIAATDVERVVDAARAIALPMDRRLFIFYRRNLSLMIRKESKIQWEWPGQDWNAKFISLRRHRPLYKILSTVLNGQGIP